MPLNPYFILSYTSFRSQVLGDKRGRSFPRLSNPRPCRRGPSIPTAWRIVGTQVILAGLSPAITNSLIAEGIIDFEDRKRRYRGANS